MRIGIFTSGLGHTQRGNETWASSLAQQLASFDCGPDQADIQVVLGGGGPIVGLTPSTRLRVCRLWTLSRESIWLRPWSYPRRYLIEQRLFTASVRRFLNRNPVSILHIPDPQLAWWLHSSPGNNRIPVIYKDGLLLGPDWNWRFNHVQVLAPYYLAQAQSNGVQTAGWRVIPHFVDVKRFRSAQEEVIGEEPNRIVAVNTSGTVNEKVRELRRNAPGGGLPEDAWLVLAVGDVAVRSAKRLDWVVDEVARCTGPNAPHLVVAGNAEQQDRDRFEARARSRLGERFHFRPRIPPSDMPRLYASVDAMAHAALREPFGLVLIEAMACGVPVVGHKFPVTEWILGDGGRVVDMEECGALAKALMEWQSDTPQHRTFSQAARRRASETFAPRKWIPEYHRWYREISSTGKMS